MEYASELNFNEFKLQLNQLVELNDTKSLYLDENVEILEKVCQYIEAHQEEILNSQDQELIDVAKGLINRVKDYNENLTSPQLRVRNLAIGVFSTDHETSVVPVVVSDSAKYNIELKDHFLRGNVSDCLLLVEKGADPTSLDELPDLTKSQTELKEWLKLFIKNPKASADNLDVFALEMGYGFKQANRMIYNNKVGEIEKLLSTCTMGRLENRGITHREVQHFLKSACPEIFEMWDQFLESFSPDDKAAFLRGDLETILIPDEGKRILEQMGNKIRQSFSEGGPSITRVHDWLGSIDVDRLIVRSTGVEDSDDHANPGAHESIPFVAPQLQSVMSAIGDVVASYFSEKSLSQRLASGDNYLFTQPPFLPVVLEEMIMGDFDQDGNDFDLILRSGVIFSHEEGKAEDVTLITTGLGNNDGVVSDRIDVDSFYVDHEGNINSVVREKGTRTTHVPGSGGRLEIRDVPSPKEVVRQPAVSENVARDLKKIADWIAKYYGSDSGRKKMDLEYTIKNGRIYVLQQRPLKITDSAEHREKSYLDLSAVKALGRGKKTTAKTLLDGKGWVREVNSPEQVLFADDLAAACDQYKYSSVRSKVQVIVVNKMATATSHAAVWLKEKRVAVIVVEDQADYYQLQERVANADPSNPMFFGPQRGLVVDTTNCTDEQVRSLVKTGAVSYPIPNEVSIPLNPILEALASGKGAAAAKAMKGLDERYQKVLKHLLRNQPSLPPSSKEAASLNELFDQMAQGSTEEAELALGKLLKALHNRMTKEIQSGTSPDVKGEMLGAFYYVVDYVEKQMSSTFKDFPPQSNERLYRMHFLRSAVFQSTSSSVMGSMSFQSALSLKKTKDVWGSNPFLVLGASALNSNARRNWEYFIHDLDPSRTNEAWKVLGEFVEEAFTLGLISPWINIEFMKVYNTASFDSSEDLLEQLMAKAKVHRPVFDWLKTERTKLSAFINQQNNWGGPKFFKKEFPKLKAQLQQWFSIDPSDEMSLVSRFHNAKGLGKIALLEFMKTVIETVDVSIKSVSGSDLPDSEKAKLFGEMLLVYSEMMNGCTHLLVRDKKRSMEYLRDAFRLGFNSKTKTSGGPSSTDEYSGIGLLDLVNKAKQGDRQAVKSLLEARSFFDVTPLVFGSRVDRGYSVYWPQTLEEHFTTYHQNMEAIRLHLMKAEGFDESVIKGTQAHKLLTTIKSVLNGAHLSSINQTSSGMVEVEITVPLRQHSSKIKLIYDPKQPKKGVEIEIKAFGGDEYRRWDQFAVAGTLLASSDKNRYAMNKPPRLILDHKGEISTVNLSLTVSPYADANKLAEVLDFMLFTISFDFNDTGQILGGLRDHTVIPWSELPGQTFRSTLFSDFWFMDEALENSEPELALTVATNALIGIAQSDIEDYKRGFPMSREPQAIVGDPNYDFIPKESIFSKASASASLQRAALITIAQVVNGYGMGRERIEKLLKHPQLVRFPKVGEALRKILETESHSGALINECLSNNKLIAAHHIAKHRGSEEFVDQIRKHIAGLIKNGDVLTANKFLVEVAVMGDAEMVDQYTGEINIEEVPELRETIESINLFKRAVSLTTEEVEAETVTLALINGTETNNRTLQEESLKRLREGVESQDSAIRNQANQQLLELLSFCKFFSIDPTFNALVKGVISICNDILLAQKDEGSFDSMHKLFLEKLSGTPLEKELVAELPSTAEKRHLEKWKELASDPTNYDNLDEAFYMVSRGTLKEETLKEIVAQAVRTYARDDEARPGPEMHFIMRLLHISKYELVERILPKDPEFMKDWNEAYDKYRP